MSSKRKTTSGKASSQSPSARSPRHRPKIHNDDDLPPSAGYLVSCDVPTKQFIQHLNDLKPVDKKFILQDLDATHLLVELKARDEIRRKVEEWEDCNVFSSVERVGEDLDMS
jgi:hypothetical protein